MTPKPGTVADLADQVERIHEAGVGTFALTWHAGDTPGQRVALIDHQAAVAEELRRRGWIAEVGVDRSQPDTERYVVRIAADEAA